jgi:hypothetical protein
MIDKAAAAEEQHAACSSTRRGIHIVHSAIGDATTWPGAILGNLRSLGLINIVCYHA